MKIRRHHLLQTAAAAIILGIAAPAAAADTDGPQANSHARAGSAIDLLQRQETARGADVCGGLKSCLREFQATAAPNVTIVESGPFDWGDAGLGAAGAFGLMLVAGGVAIVARHSHGSPA